MASIELWTGLHGSGRHDRAMELVAGEKDSAVWWLVDEMRRAERTELDLCDKRGGVLTGVEVLVTGRLALHILNSSGRVVPTVDVEVRRLLLRDLLSSSKIQSQVETELGQGWARRLEEFHARWEEERFLGPRSDRHPIETLLKSRYPWALDVLGAYERRLEDEGLVDEDSLPRVACEWMENAGFSAPDLLVVDRLGPMRPSLLEVEHLLAERAGHTIVLLDEVRNAGGGLALAHQDGQTWRTRHECSIVPHDPPPASLALAQALFAQPGQSRPETVHHHATLHHHLDRAAEVRHVAGEVSRLLHDEHIPDSEIAVVCTSLTDYAPHVEELFGRYGVRADLRLGQPLSSSPVARLMVALFTMRAEGISREGITDVLLNPYVKWGKHFTDKAKVLAFDTAARRARIIDGRDGLKASWLEPFEAEIARIREQAALIAGEEEADGDEEEGATGAMNPEVRRERQLRRAEWLEQALGEFKQLAGLILSLPDPCTVEEALDWLHEMQRSLEIRKRVHRMARRDPERGQRDVLALGHLELTLDHVATTLRLQGRQRWPVSKFAELMRLAIGTSRLRASRRLHGGVPVLGPLDLRGLRVSHLFFLGLTADTWPRSPGIDLADPFASSWSDVDRLAESHALTLEAFFAGSEVYLSTPCPARGEGNVAPSPLLDEIEAAGVVVELAPADEVRYRSALDLLPAVGRDFQSEKRSQALRRLAAAALQTGNSTVRWPHAAQAAAIETIRQDPATLTRWEGMIGEGPVGDEIARRVLARPWSASRLDTYAQCPIKFLFQNVLKLEGVEEVEDEMDAASLGSLIHEILAIGTQRLAVQRGRAVDFSENPEEVAAVMDAVAAEVLDRYSFDNLYWKKTVAGVRSGLLDDTEPAGYLKRVIDHHSGNKLGGETIHHVEAGFGVDVEPGQEMLFEEPIRITADGVTIPLAGRIDRISRHPKKGWRVWDYKVSKKTPSNVRKIAGGRSFQLPLYFWALEELRDSGRLEDTPFDRSSYYVIKPEGNPTLTQVWTYASQQAEDTQLKERVVAIDRALRAGRFHHPLSQDNDLCPDTEFNFCPFRDVCRRDHDLFREREEHLDPSALKEAYILGFQERLTERIAAGEGEA